MFAIHAIPAPEPGDDSPHPWLAGVHEIDAEVCQELHGHDDFLDSLDSLVGRLRGSVHAAQAAWVAVEADAVLGYIWARSPLREDRDAADFDLAVRGGARRRGVGTALLDAATAALAADGRTTWLTWAFAPGRSAEGPDAIPAASGTGAVDGRHPAAAFLRRHGFSLEQVEQPSTLTVDAATLARADDLGATAASVAEDDYELLGWTGRTPSELADGMADLHARMSTDVPMATELAEPQVWDAERLRVAEDRTVELGYHWVTTAARHRATGVMAAYTTLQWPGHHPDGVWQEDTLVHADHRGHRLGLWTKAANLRRLVADNPDAARIHTWNAAENTHMLAINDALGFRPTGLEGTWRRRAS